MISSGQPAIMPLPLPARKAARARAALVLVADDVATKAALWSLRHASGSALAPLP
eukprot:COSAG01_NODE_1379_length_10522_cov_25.951454_6_plen_55_part_00